ncbi:MAG: hypothetical protein ACTHLX_19940 [Candidatus Binatia bacterium]
MAGMNSEKRVSKPRELQPIKHARLMVSTFLCVALFFPSYAYAQSNLKKVRLALPTKTVSFLAFYAALHHRY